MLLNENIQNTLYSYTIQQAFVKQLLYSTVFQDT